MKIKKNLKVKLFAGNELVTESSDPNLWGRVLSAITGGASQVLNQNLEVDIDTDISTKVEKFAKELGVSVDEVQGACSPSNKEPYLHLDEHYWEAFQRNHNVMGRGAISHLQVAATLLTLWFKHIKKGKPTAEQAQVVLNTINLKDTNFKRTLGRSSWLQYRDNNISINPAEISKAVGVAKAYCTKTSLEDGYRTATIRKRKSKKTPQKKVKKTSKKKVKKNTKKKVKNKSSYKKSVSAKSKRPGPKAIIDRLIQEGFFKQHRLINDIVCYCRDSLVYTYRTNELSSPLGRFIRDKKLKRKKNKDGQFEYFE